VNIRPAREADEAMLRGLWEEFEREVPEPPGFPPESWSEQHDALRASMAGGGVVFVAEEEGRLLGVVHLQPPDRGVVHVEWAHVTRAARRRGTLKALLREAVADMKARGASLVTLEALTTNEPALAVWRKLGFEEVEYFMASPLESLERRLDDAAPGPSRASTHVQTDDRLSVERAIAQFVPRLEQPLVRDAENGWIRVEEPFLDADRTAQSRFAGDLSDRLGAVVVALAVEQGAVVRFRLYERGLMVDEYLSVPTYYGELPKGDELALAANPTLVARLTGADHEAVRRVARNASSPAALPPADELYGQIAHVLGLEP
jgi:ribosomal protein S18 acetylase RimI-like enzyme